MLSDEEDTLIDFLEEQHGCHTVILFGSRARGTHRADSDWDVLALHDGAAETSVHTHVEGVGEVNAYLYPRAMGVFHPKAPSPLFQPFDTFIGRLRHGRVLAEEDGLGSGIVLQAQRMFATGPAPVPADRLAHVRYQFFEKYLPVIAGHTPEAHFERHDALRQMMFYYFRLRGAWLPSLKEWPRALADEDPVMLALLEQAETPAASIEDFRALFTYVFGE